MARKDGLSQTSPPLSRTSMIAWPVRRGELAGSGAVEWADRRVCRPTAVIVAVVGRGSGLLALQEGGKDVVAVNGRRRHGSDRNGGAGKESDGMHFGCVFWMG